MHYVFLIHGSGRNKPGWSKPFVDTLCTKATTYTGKATSALLAGVKFVEINFSGIIDDLIKQFLEGDGSTGPMHDWLKDAYDRRKDGQAIVEGKTEANLAANITLEFLMDGLVYLWNPEMARFLQLKIASQVLPVINASGPDDRFSFVGHGMGTKILFDFLHRFYGGADSEIPYKVTASGDPTRDSPTISYLYMIGNASYGLSKLDFPRFDPNNSYVRIVDRFASPRQGGVVQLGYRVFSNEFDWLSRIGQNEKISSKQISENVILKAVPSLFLHSLEAYLEHPAVNIRLVEDLFMGRGAEVANRNQMIADYDRKRNVVQVAKDIKEIVNKFGTEEGAATTGKVPFFEFLKDASELINKIINS